MMHGFHICYSYLIDSIHLREVWELRFFDHVYVVDPQTRKDAINLGCTYSVQEVVHDSVILDAERPKVI
jgi:hypothetical protein